MVMSNNLKAELKISCVRLSRSLLHHGPISANRAFQCSGYITQSLAIWVFVTPHGLLVLQTLTFKGPKRNSSVCLQNLNLNFLTDQLSCLVFQSLTLNNTDTDANVLNHIFIQQKTAA